MTKNIERRSIVLALTFLMPIAAVSPVNAAPAQGGWVKVITNPQTKLAYYVDRGTLQNQSGFSYFWLYINSSVGQALGTENKSSIYGIAAYLSADCRQAVFRVRSVELINQQGKQIGTENRGDSGPLAQFNQRNPVGRSVLKYVCDR